MSAKAPAARETPPRITRFTKIKFDGQKVRLEYQVTRPGEGDPDEFAVNCSDKPLPGFMAALQALVVDVLAICEFPSSEASKVTMRGVTLSYVDDVLGAVLTALRTLMSADAPLILNSPYLPERPRESDPTGHRLPRATVIHLRALIEEAERYLRGDRAQGSLFGEGEGAAKPAENYSKTITNAEKPKEIGGGDEAVG